MNSLGEPTCLDDLDFLMWIPELREPMMAGDFRPFGFYDAEYCDFRVQDEIAVYQFPETPETYRFSVRAFFVAGKMRWQAWGDYCEMDNSPSDACYDFLDGGGSFSSREAAACAIHVFISHLYSKELTDAEVTHDV